MLPWLWRWWVTIRLACLRWWLGCAGEGWSGSAWQAWKVVGVMADWSFERIFVSDTSRIHTNNNEDCVGKGWGGVFYTQIITEYMVHDCRLLQTICKKMDQMWQELWHLGKFLYISKVSVWGDLKSLLLMLLFLMSHRKWKIRWGRSGLNSLRESSEIPTYLARYWVPKSLSPCRYRAFFETFILWIFSRRLE